MASPSKTPKGNSRCGACGRLGHNAKNPLCPDSVAKAAAAKALRAFSIAMGSGRDNPEITAGLVPQPDGSLHRYATVEMVQRAALSAAEKVAS